MNGIFQGIPVLALLFSVQVAPIPRAGQILWLKPESLESSLSAGDPVATWSDASPVGNDAVQTNAAKQPVFQTDARNGFPAVLFEKSGRRLSVPSLQLPYETTLFFVSYDTEQLSGGSIHHSLLAADNSPYLAGGDGYGIGYARSVYDGVIVALSNGSSLQHLSDLYTQYARNAWEILTFKKSGTTATLYRDGYLRGEQTFSRSSGTNWHTGYLLGGDVSARDYKGGLLEVIAYDRALSAQEVDQVQHYLSAKYGMALAAQSEMQSTDPRFFGNGTLMLKSAYVDQPYMVKCSESDWMAVMTCSDIAERGSDRHLEVLRTTNAGQTWAESSVLEPPEELRQPSWGTLLKTPSGRVYCFYNIDRLPEEGDGINYVYRFSDDRGLTWSDRYELPVRKTWLNKEFNSFSSWGIDPPLVVGDTVYIAFTKFGPNSSGRPGEGFFFKSGNILTESDPARIQWDMLPSGDHGLASERVGTLQEEHNIESLGGDDLYCAFRTLKGYVGEAYSTNGAVSWTEPNFARYADGREIKNPRACPMVWHCKNGNYLLWFHNNDGREAVERNKDRNPAWLSGGILTNGVIQWSQPEPALFTFRPPYNAGMSYPNLIEHDGKYFIAATDKKTARLCEVDGVMLSNLWNQASLTGVPSGGLLYDSDQSGSVPSFLPDVGDGGFTVTCEGGLVSAPSNVLWSAQDGQGNGAAVVYTEEGKAAFEYKDRYMDAPLRWETDESVYENSTVSFIVDGAANWIYVVVDGVLCDGGEERQFGWGPIPYQMAQLTESPVKIVCNAQRVILHDRALSVSEVIGMHHDILFSSDSFEQPVYTNGPVNEVNPPGDSYWVEWDQDGGNNSSPEYAVVQSQESFSGAQSLAIADTTNRVIARLSGLGITQPHTFFEAACKSVATNDFGAATITLRFDSGTKRFVYNQLGGQPCWFDPDNNILRSDPVSFGEWHIIRIETDLQSRTYRVLVDRKEAFSGTFSATAAQINSWEIDVSATDPGRAPREPFAFFVDDLRIGAGTE